MLVAAFSRFPGEMVVTTMHRALALIALAANGEARNQSAACLGRFALRAAALIWITRRGDLFEAVLAGITEELVEGHP